MKTKLIATAVLALVLLATVPMMATAGGGVKVWVSTQDGVLSSTPVGNRADLKIDPSAGQMSFGSAATTKGSTWYIADSQAPEVLIVQDASTGWIPIQAGHTYAISLYTTTLADRSNPPDWSATVTVTPTTSVTVTATAPASIRGKLADGASLSVPLGTTVALKASQLGTWQVIDAMGTTVYAGKGTTASFTLKSGGLHTVTFSPLGVVNPKTGTETHYWPWTATIMVTNTPPPPV